MFDNFNGDIVNIICYELFIIVGFVFLVFWGEDDVWDVVLIFEKELGEFEVVVGIVYR